MTTRADVVGFAATSAGIGTYRFLLNNQPAGTERSGLLESTVGYGTDVVHAGTFSLNSILQQVLLLKSLQDLLLPHIKFTHCKQEEGSGNCCSWSICSSQ